MIWNNILLKNNKVLFGILLAFCCCISHAEEYKYWDDLDELVATTTLVSLWYKLLSLISVLQLSTTSSLLTSRHSSKKVWV